MKLLLENWRRFLNEDQEVNEIFGFGKKKDFDLSPEERAATVQKPSKGKEYVEKKNLLFSMIFGPLPRAKLPDWAEKVWTKAGVGGFVSKYIAADGPDGQPIRNNPQEVKKVILDALNLYRELKHILSKQKVNTRGFAKETRVNRYDVGVIVPNELKHLEDYYIWIERLHKLYIDAGNEPLRDFSVDKSDMEKFMQAAKKRE